MNNTASILSPHCALLPSREISGGLDIPPSLRVRKRPAPDKTRWVRQSRYDREQLLACANGELFGVGNAQLPAPPLLMLDRITHISSLGGLFDRGEIVAELDITPDLWFFGSHFRGDPVMPGSLTLDALWQLLGFYMAWSGFAGPGRALGAGELRISGPVTPETRLVTYRVHVKKLMAKNPAVAIADGYMEADGTTVYVAKSLWVGLIPPAETVL
jgi:3-hydroxyacyl-[acyl-carrier protein] dehydratase/trans-2-decenoyl-[acyl-carrier protein] isomerase